LLLYKACMKFQLFWADSSLENFWKTPSLVIISPLKKIWPFIWTNLNSLYPRFCTKFDWIWPSGSGEDFPKIFFRYYLPLEKGVPLHLNKLESPPPRISVLSQVKIVPVVLEKSKM
jgi:hypothetical protein